MELITSDAPGCTLSVKRPSPPVVAPLVVPCSSTVAPGKAPPSEAVTCPLMARDWARAAAILSHPSISTNPINKGKRFFMRKG